MSEEIDDRTAYALSRVFDSGMRTCPGCGQNAFELTEEDGSVVQPVKVGDRYWHPGCKDAHQIRQTNNTEPLRGRVYAQLGWKGLLTEDLPEYRTDAEVTASASPPAGPFMLMVTSPSAPGRERKQEVARVEQVIERGENQYVFILTRGMAGTNAYFHPAGVSMDLVIPDRDPREVE